MMSCKCTPIEVCDECLLQEEFNHHCSICGHDNAIVHLPKLARDWWLCQDCYQEGEE